jgi:hypothetical protein
MSSNANQLNAAAKTATSKAVEVSAFHKDVYAAINTARTAVDKAQGTMQQKLANLLRSKYGTVMPTFEQFRADRAALKELATQKGLADDQWLRKPYNAAVHLLYGALPEAQTAAAIAKRALRAANEAAGVTTVKDGKKVAPKPDAGKAGAPKGETAPRNPAAEETIEQYIARVGLWQVMDACARILNADKSTADAAKAIQPVVRKYLKAA